VQVAAAVELRAGVDVGEAADLLEAEGVLERRCQRAREGLEATELLVAHVAADPAPEECKRSDSFAGLVGDRDGQAASQAELVLTLLVLRVAVRQLDGARLAGLGRDAEELPGRLLRGEPERGDERLLVGAGDDDHGGGRVPQPRGRLERPREDALEVDAAADLAQVTEPAELGPRPLALLARTPGLLPRTGGVLARVRESADAVVRERRLRGPVGLVGPRSASPETDGDGERDHEREQSHRGRADGDPGRTLVPDGQPGPPS
jgi:hypothetical protein